MRTFVERITPAHSLYPRLLIERLGEQAPGQLALVGNTQWLALPKTAFFCSTSAPADVVLRTLDVARQLREQGVTVISGFQSPLEQECLKVLLRGEQPVILCPARAIERLRLPLACREAFEAGRLLVVSPFIEKPRRVTRESALYRNAVAAAMAEAAFVAFARPGSSTEDLLARLREWGVSIIGE